MTYQIIHTFEGFLSTPLLDGMTILLGRNEEKDNMADMSNKLIERLTRLKEMKIDGLIVNLGGVGYLSESTNWEVFVACLKICIDLEFKIWIYDEKGYPSGSAGGIVLEEQPALEAKGIKKVEISAGESYVFYEKGEIRVLSYLTEDGYTVRSEQPEVFMHIEKEGKFYARTKTTLYYGAAIYEGCHASGSFAEKRRYVNLLEQKATECFIDVTHKRYESMLPHSLFEKIDMFFTDEPSLMHPVISNKDSEFPVPVLDELDKRIPILPTLPYCKALEELEDFYYILPELFEKKESPSLVKAKFWEKVLDIYEQSFAITLKNGCEQLKTSLTGHIIAEETPYLNMIFQVNPMRILKHFHIPGLDVLSSKLENISIFAHKLVYSTAFLNGKTHIMSETNDFQENILDKTGIAKANDICAIVALQFLLGVRDFAFYYDFRQREVKEYSLPNELAHRLEAYGKDLIPHFDVALYIPFETLYGGYYPTTQIFEYSLDEQPQFVQKLNQELLQLCERLFENNVQFILCDKSHLPLLERNNIGIIIRPFDDITGIKSTVPDFLAGLRVQRFKQNVYYCFNPSEDGHSLRFDKFMEIYDPYRDIKFKQDHFVLEPQKACFLREIREDLAGLRHKN